MVEGKAAARDGGRPDKGAPARRAARLAAVLALYQMEATGIGVDAAIREFETFRFTSPIDDVDLSVADRKFFADILRGTVEVQSRLDRVLTNRLAAGWKLTRLDATARAILRAGLYELIRRADVPTRVVIDEYLHIAHAFFDGDDPRFINAVLDGAAHDARDADEFRHERE